jgi:DNA-damage-inducible protein J
MASKTVIQVRIDKKVKEQASQVLCAKGLTVSEAVRMFLTGIANGERYPFAFGTPNAVTLAAMLETNEILDARKASLGGLDV